MSDMLDYWIDLSECTCNANHPIGSCEKCDLESVKKEIETMKEECTACAKILAEKNQLECELKDARVLLEQWLQPGSFPIDATRQFLEREARTE